MSFDSQIHFTDRTAAVPGVNDNLHQVRSGGADGQWNNAVFHSNTTNTADAYLPQTILVSDSGLPAGINPKDDAIARQHFTPAEVNALENIPYQAANFNQTMDAINNAPPAVSENLVKTIKGYADSIVQSEIAHPGMFGPKA